MFIGLVRKNFAYVFLQSLNRLCLLRFLYKLFSQFAVVCRPYSSLFINPFPVCVPHLIVNERTNARAGRCSCMDRPVCSHMQTLYGEWNHKSD